MRFLAGLLIMCELSSLVTISHAANHYCVNKHTVSLEMDDFHHRDETIIPQVVDEPEQRRLEPKRCRWDVRLRSSSPDLQQVVIEGVPSHVRSNDSAIQNATGISIETLGVGSMSSVPVRVGMFQVVSINKRKHFSVQANWNPRTQKLGSGYLRIQMPLPVFCSRNMLSFNGICYAVSAFRQNVTAAISSIRGDAQLASFSSMAHIKDFITANTERLQQFPYRQPLSLGQPVRLGMFLRAADTAVLSVVRRNRSCQLQAVPNSEEFGVTGRVAGPCLSLRVAEPDRAVVEFCDCSSPMLSLLSFPEKARSVMSSSHCNGSELARRIEQLQSGADAVLVAAVLTTLPGAVTETGMSAEIIASVSVIAGVILLTVAIGGAVLARRRCRSQSYSIPPVDQERKSVVSTARETTEDQQCSVELLLQTTNL